MALPKRYGIERGWPLGPGQYRAPYTPGIPANALLSRIDGTPLISRIDGTILVSRIG